jgi:hypothetical protein
MNFIQQPSLGDFYSPHRRHLVNKVVMHIYVSVKSVVINHLTLGYITTTIARSSISSSFTYNISSP